MVLVIFFILLVFGLVFYARFSETSAQDSYRETMIMHAMDATERFQYSPEVLCSRVSVGSDTNCFDLLKLKGFERLFEDEEKEVQYGKYYPNNLVEVHIIYPEDFQDEFVLFDTTDGDSFNSETSFMPAVFFNATSDERYFGYLTFTVKY